MPKLIAIVIMCLMGYVSPAMADKKPTREQMDEFKKLIGSGAINKYEFESFLNQQRFLPQAIEGHTYSVRIPCNLPETIKILRGQAGLLKQAYETRLGIDIEEWEGIIQKNFPDSTCKEDRVTISIIRFQRPVILEEVVQVLKEWGYRAANARELLALAMVQPIEAHDHMIVALGSVWRPEPQDPQSDLFPCLWEGDQFLGTCKCVNRILDGFWRFAAVRISE